MFAAMTKRVRAAHPFLTRQILYALPRRYLPHPDPGEPGALDFLSRMPLARVRVATMCGKGREGLRVAVRYKRAIRPPSAMLTMV